jgi:hypothetical protein
LAPIRSIVPHDPATDCLRSILDTSSVFEVATSTLSACSSRRPGWRNSSSDSNDSDSAVRGIESEFFADKSRNGEAQARCSPASFPRPPAVSLSLLLVVLRSLKRSLSGTESFCKQGILMFVKVEH